MNVYEKLMTVQAKLKAPKGQYNSFGKYNYRSCEDILEGLKPVLVEVGAIVLLTDSIEQIGDRVYVKATAQFIDIEKNVSVSVSAFAREDETKKGMDLAQVTGSVSSYARKYALNGLFCIDDTKDSDATCTHGKDNTPKTENNAPGKTTEPKNHITADESIELLDLLTEKKKDIKKIYEYYKIKSLEELTVEQAKKVRNQLEGK